VAFVFSSFEDNCGYGSFSEGALIRSSFGANLGMSSIRRW
jgi:hypothetical protein